MRSRLEIIFELEGQIDPEKIISTLDTIDLKYKSMRRLPLTELSSVTKGKEGGCCGGGGKRVNNTNVTVSEKRTFLPKLSMKDKLMSWVYFNISTCLFCGGLRLGVYIGSITMGIYALIVGG